MYPEYVEIDGKQYKINTDFRVAIECNRVAQDDSIGDIERPLAIIYLLYGDEGLEAKEHYKELLELGRKYLLCGQEYDSRKNQKPDMDFIQDMPYIEASFMSDFHIDLDRKEMHWWKFNKLMNGLSNSELGDCCILNRVRNLRNFDVSKIKDSKERQRIIEAQKEVALHQDVKLTARQRESVKKFKEMLGIKEG